MSPDEQGAGSRDLRSAPKSEKARLFGGSTDEVDGKVRSGMKLEERIRSLPQGCGVYLFKDASGKILYVGKAANLAKRVRSYF
ncbi:unnamed protein product, partial [marine sediment metagenome]